MMISTSAITINEKETEPLSDYVVSFLTSQKKESPYLDFKFLINIGKDSDFPEIVKDILAFSNYGGGWILIGWKEVKNNYFLPEGVPQEYDVNQASLQEKFNSYVDAPLQLLYREITNSENKRFGFIYIPPSNTMLVPNKDGRYVKGDKERTVFRKGDLLYRRGTQSIPPSEYEIQLIKKRLEKENYRISVLSGQPDEVDEDILSNLFEVSKFPLNVYLGENTHLDRASIRVMLKQNGVFPEFYDKFIEWNGKIVTFENLKDQNNPYAKIIDMSTVVVEKTSDWLADSNKSRLIMTLLNRELIHYAISKNFYHDRDSGCLFYATTTERRTERWAGRYRSSNKSVAAKMFASQLGMYIYIHPAVFASFMRFGEKIYMYTLPKFVLTIDGRRTIHRSDAGAIITRLSYDTYNSSYLNNVSFWINRLGNGQKINIGNYLEISAEPSSAKTMFGIVFDMPSAEFKLSIEEPEIGLGEIIDDSF